VFVSWCSFLGVRLLAGGALPRRAEPRGSVADVIELRYIPEQAMAMTTQELRAHLRTLPADHAEEIRVARKRFARRAYRDRHLRDEKRRQADWYRRKMAALQEDPEQLALFHERDAERKRRERAGRRESE
jgi:hypothetical protein